MADYGLKKNGEGYADPTAYAAITGIQKPGEVLAYKGGDALIIKNQGTFCNILRLGEYKPHSIEIAGRYAQPGMISYAFNDLLTIYQGKITPDEFESVMADIENALGVELKASSVVIATDAAEIRKMEESVAVLKERLSDAESMASAHMEMCAAAENAATKYRIQLEMMQQMYSDLMEKFLQRV